MRVPVTLTALFSLSYAITSPPSGAAVVGSGQKYTTVQSAVDSGASVIFIKAGTYNEQVYIPAGTAALTIYGSSSSSDYSGNTVTIQAGKSQDDGLNDDGTGTLRAHSDNFKLYNVNIVNTRGSGSQAIALSAYGDKQGYYGCAFKGFQDTVLSNEGHHLFVKSLVQGATDFIFGQQALAWFQSCDIRVLAASLGFITGPLSFLPCITSCCVHVPYANNVTANGRDSSTDPSWYVISDSTVAAASGNTVPAGAYYLGRPWRDYARVTFQNTALSNVINSAGWSQWSTSQPNTDHVQFQEYNNTGAGASGKRASFSSKASSEISASTILGSGYTSWVDSAYFG